MPKQRLTGLLVGVLLVLSTGCGGYGELGPAAYDYSMALYAISNRHAADKLDGVSQQIEQSHAAGELTNQEARWLNAIIDKAQRGDWQDAAQDARRMMEDQVQPATAGGQ